MRAPPDAQKRRPPPGSGDGLAKAKKAGEDQRHPLISPKPPKPQHTQSDGYVAEALGSAVGLLRRPRRQVPSLNLPGQHGQPLDLLGLIVCEGIESGLSLHEATGCGVWAAGSSSRLAALADAIPDHADCVTVAADEDEAGKAGAVKLAQRLGARGIHVEVSLPDVGRAAA